MIRQMVVGGRQVDVQSFSKAHVIRTDVSLIIISNCYRVEDCTNEGFQTGMSGVEWGVA